VQAENHLHTIQGETGKTVEILEKMQNSQAEMNGYLRGVLSKDIQVSLTLDEERSSRVARS
jgi:hypothetical protein